MIRGKTKHGVCMQSRTLQDHTKVAQCVQCRNEILCSLYTLPHTASCVQVDIPISRN